MGSVSVVSLKLVRERTVSYRGRAVVESSQASALFRELIGDLDRESVWVACLDSKARVCCVSQVSMGTINASLVHPREVYKVALLANAASIILAHNHPSGDPAPSLDDMIITDRLEKSGEALGIKFNDHIILGEDSYYSFADEGKL